MFVRVRPRGCELRGKLPQRHLKVADLFLQLVDPVGNCIKIGIPGKSILRYYFQENRTSRRPRPTSSLGISFPGRPIFIQFIPVGLLPDDARRVLLSGRRRTANRVVALQLVVGLFQVP